MNSRILSIKNKLKKYLKDKEVLDVIVFGSAVKGKAAPQDIDIAIISDKDIKADIEGFHISILKPRDFFTNIPSIINTLFREGYSLKKNMSFSENYKFKNAALFVYELKNLSLSSKVKIVSLLRGKKGKNGMVESYGGKWLANQVFLAPVESQHIIEKFLVNFKVKFQKFFILIH